MFQFMPKSAIYWKDVVTLLSRCGLDPLLSMSGKWGAQRKDAQIVVSKAMARVNY